MATPLSSAAKPTDRSSQHVTPPQSPTRPLCKPSAYQVTPNTLSPPLTPESQRYLKAFVVSSQYKKAIGSDSRRGTTERLSEEASVSGYKGLGYDNVAGSAANEGEIQADVKNRLENIPQTALAPVETLPKGPRGYEGTFKLQVSAEGHYEEYGRGAWSVVYRAEHTPQHRTRDVKGDSPKMIVAVKAPLYQGSTSILEHEALILTHLAQTATQSEAAHYIITFHGYDLPTKSLILEPVPLTLATYSKTYALEAKNIFSHKTIRDPIVGTQCWLQIVHGLVEGLGFLQARSVVHGDIKPTNILMRPHGGGGGFPPNGNNENIYPREYQNTATAIVLSHTPIFCDFSSSRLLTDPSPPSALTSRFAAPELLNPRTPGIATFASDIYSLALSLLSPALGADVYTGAANAMQALHWAKEGRPLDFARSGDAGLRVGRGGVADRVLGGATRRTAEDRWSVDEWGAVVRGVITSRGDEGAGKQ
ncbi:MAG: hypothetical protein M1840_004373 [Geoglossum simile]|nr:MAG: hypothetical protein M1840_004373 [Geoglossum simile]